MTDKEQIIYTEEICPYCDSTVELPPFKGIYECPECKELIVCCSMCEEQSCNECKYTLLTQGKEQLARKTQECENLKEDYKELEQRHNEAFQDFERLKKECEELTELLKLRTNDRINKLERAIIRRNVKIDRYRKALEEIEEFCITYSDNHDAYVTVYKYILDIINKAKKKGGEND